MARAARNTRIGRAATRLAARYPVSETLIRRIPWREICVTQRPREAMRLPAVATLLFAGPGCPSSAAWTSPPLISRPAGFVCPREDRRLRADGAMVPALHEILLAARAERRTSGGPAFPTGNGTRQHPDNVRSRLLASVRERANELLAEREQPVIGHMTRTRCGGRSRRPWPPRSACRCGGRCICSATPIRRSRCASTSRRSTWPGRSGRLRRVLGCNPQRGARDLLRRRAFGGRPAAA